MSQLIDELKSDHVNLSSALCEIEKLGITTTQGQIVLAGAKAALLAHLQKEDEEMYPLLREAAKSDANLQEKLDNYAADMANVSQIVLAFFAKYEGNQQSQDFEKDFRGVYLALTKRIISEESKLFPEFNRLASES